MGDRKEPTPAPADAVRPLPPPPPPPPAPSPQTGQPTFHERSSECGWALRYDGKHTTWFTEDGSGDVESACLWESAEEAKEHDDEGTGTPVHILRVITTQFLGEAS